MGVASPPRASTLACSATVSAWLRRSVAAHTRLGPDVDQGALREDRRRLDEGPFLSSQQGQECIEASTGAASHQPELTVERDRPLVTVATGVVRA